MVGFSGSAISNMLSNVSSESKALPWQPNFGKSKQKIAPISVLRKKNTGLFQMNSKVFGVGDFKYAI